MKNLCVVFVAVFLTVSLASAAETGKCNGAKEIRANLEKYLKPIVNKAMRENANPVVHDAIGKAFFDYTHWNVWHPVRTAVRDDVCTMYVAKARELLGKKIDGVVTADLLDKYSKEIHEAVVDAIAPKVEKMIADACGKEMTESKGKEAAKRARIAGRNAVVDFFSSKKGYAIKKQIMALATKRVEDTAPDKKGAISKRWVVVKISETVFKSAKKNIIETLPEEMVSKMYEARKGRMGRGMVTNMSEHMFRHVRDRVWADFKAEINERKWSSITDKDWQVLARLCAKKLEKEVESRDRLRRSYELRWNKFQEASRRNRDRK